MKARSQTLGGGIFDSLHEKRLPGPLLESATTQFSFHAFISTGSDKDDYIPFYLKI